MPKVLTYDSGGMRLIDVEAGGTRMVFEKVLNDTDITNKYVTLSTAIKAPINANLEDVQVTGAPELMNGVDFILTDATTVSWNGYALDGKAVAGDTIRVAYNAD